jgi:hypothetical protein
LQGRYRAKGILAAARWFVGHGSELSRDELRSLPMTEAVERLLPVPTIGPYAEAIVLSMGAGRGRRLPPGQLYPNDHARVLLRPRGWRRRATCSRTGQVGPRVGSDAHLLTTNTER